MGTIESKDFNWTRDGVTFFRNHRNKIWANILLYIPIAHATNGKKKIHPNVLKCWNLALCIFNTVGTYKTIPFLLKFNNVCDTTYLENSAISKWVYYFNLSKLVELWDILLIDRVSKEHLYHHLMTLLYVFHSSLIENHSGIWNSGPNYFAHSIMYLHLFLKGLGVASPLKKFVGVSQLIEMIIGISVQLLTFHCSTHNRFNTGLGLCMYVSYLYLFGRLYFQKKENKTDIKI